MVKGILIVILLLSSIGLIATILLQSGRSAGLSGAISGAGEAFFGKKKGMDELFGKLSIGFAVVFFLSSLAVSFLK
ncbi:preprotein translocase, SecG subunit [Acididesulfobacillus acetoxydans]|uniref:Protein-export membrane protein SecG n=1 Tax=Acididesulfobacillus acetoxydans TaxID=1561005 RepID=A0A8S0W1P7_9FIRM|nr:preprotein translocase subunit SecG [Acididesulfobacillus acetoxydans]CAA7599678.1 preprotein translocase, SecG subunit [Acididesulfobacillus acetoxydans]CEJ06230.1 Preprotein translocase SecG subunit [Acididesulfobacillus acetoxydans]